MTQKEISTWISVMCYQKTGKASAIEEFVSGEVMEIPTDEYVCWLERELFKLLNKE